MELIRFHSPLAGSALAMSGGRLRSSECWAGHRQGRVGHETRAGSRDSRPRRLPCPTLSRGDRYPNGVVGRQSDDEFIWGRAADVHHNAVAAPGLMRHTVRRRMRLRLADIRRREGCRHLPHPVPCMAGTPCHGLVGRGPWCVSILGASPEGLRVRQRIRTLIRLQYIYNF